MATSPTYYSPIMATERIQRRIDRLLDQIEQEADQQNWQRVRELAGEVLEFAPDNADATTFFAEWINGKLKIYPTMEALEAA